METAVGHIIKVEGLEYKIVSEFPDHWGCILANIGTYPRPLLLLPKGSK